jgi:sigma-B regulation protein RsbU (phosphoserine phosphatase)
VSAFGLRRRKFPPPSALPPAPRLPPAAFRLLDSLVVQQPSAPSPSAQDRLAILFDLGRQVTAVLNLDDLLAKIPQLISRLMEFHAFAAYLLDEKKNELAIAYSVGYPGDVVGLRLKVGEGLVGAAVAEGAPILVNDVATDPRYVEMVPGTRSAIVVPLRRKGRVLGAMNLLGRNANQFTEADVLVLRQFGAHAAVAIENARLFERERQHAETLETLAEIGREVASILDLEPLLTRLAQLVNRFVRYRTFGIMLLDQATGLLEMKLAVRYGEANVPGRVRLGEGLVGYAALHKTPVLVPDVTADPRYVKVVEDVRSELVIPLLCQDRVVGVFDLESPEPDAFSREDEEILTLLGTQAAVAIENARLYETIRANEMRLEKELRFAQRVQAALLPAGLPKKLKGIDVAARFAPARELGGDLYDFLLPTPGNLVVAVGDVSGKGVPAALYSAFAGELIRSRTFRSRYQPNASSPATVLAGVNTILHERNLEEYYCTLCYALFDMKRRAVTLANSGLPYPFRCSGDACGPIELAGLPLGVFGSAAYETVSFDLRAGDIFVFCTDGVFEAMDADAEQFGAARLARTIQMVRHESPRRIVNAVFEAVQAFRGDTPPNDDMTAVALKITS